MIKEKFDFIIRNGTFADIDIIIEAIIAAEKSGSDVLSYTAIFGLTEEQTKGYLKEMLEEEIDGCELSLSSYLIAETRGEPVAVMGAWIEGEEDVPSSIIKGNLLSYFLPRESMIKAIEISPVISEMAIEYISNTLCIGIVYVKEKFRRKGLVLKLLNEHIIRAMADDKDLDIFIQVFGNNIAAIKAYKKLGFKEWKVVRSDNNQVIKFLPSKIKYFLKKNIKSNLEWKEKK